MQNNTLLGFIGGVVGGVLVTFLVMNTSGERIQHQGMMESDREVSHMGMSMEDMSMSLQNKNGDEFDRAFIEMMIDHHQGAIDMAKLIPARAKHDEIKELGKAIITAQTKEISDMETWAKAWGYSR